MYTFPFWAFSVTPAHSEQLFSFVLLVDLANGNARKVMKFHVNVFCVQ